MITQRCPEGLGLSNRGQRLKPAKPLPVPSQHQWASPTRQQKSRLMISPWLKSKPNPSLTNSHRLDRLSIWTKQKRKNLQPRLPRRALPLRSWPLESPLHPLRHRVFICSLYNLFVLIGLEDVGASVRPFANYSDLVALLCFFFLSVFVLKKPPWINWLYYLPLPLLI